MAENTEVRLPAWEEEILSNLRSTDQLRYNWKILCFQSVTSTMDHVVSRIEGLNRKDALLILAKDQTHGRGRQGRSWSGGSGNFFATFVLPSELAISKLGGLSLAVGVGIADGLDSLGCKLALKWPNDLMSKMGKKVGGILIELKEYNATQWIIVGVGINISSFPDDIPWAGSLSSEFGIETTSSVLSARLIQNIESVVIDFVSNGFVSIRDRWLSRALFLGRMLKVDSGQEVLEGEFIGLGDHGELLLKDKSGIHKIFSGHIVSINER